MVTSKNWLIIDEYKDNIVNMFNKASRKQRKPTPIKPYLHVHLTHKIWVIVLWVMIWLMSTTAFTWFAINSNYLNPHYSCESPVSLAPLKQAPTPTEGLASKISTVYKVPEPKASEIVGVVQQYTRNGFPSTKLVLGIIAAESSFKHNAVSSGNAKGYMQLTKSSGKNTSTAIYDNIPNGIALLREYHERLGSPDAAVMAYNVGIGAYLKGERPYEYLNSVKHAKRLFEA